tara:strand:- start:159 stop:1049 length:891 start_codon:yes stop_codon:yes gene_type:complete
MGLFTSKQLAFFNASLGAGSIVTWREEFDSQITIDSNEKTVLHAHIPASSIPRMSIKKPSTTSKFSFKNFNTGTIVQLNLNFPKSRGNETRLYLSETSGFKPKAGEYWFLFEERGTKNLFIGTVDYISWAASGGVKSRPSSKTPLPKIHSPAPPITDEEDHIYQTEIYSTIPAATKTGTYKKEHRDRVVALKSIQNASNKCELNASHKTFTLESGLTYVEAHHLIPIAKQTKLGINLDIPQNIVALCPNCHRAVHHAEKIARLDILKILYKMRVSKLQSAGIKISLSQIAKMYDCL